MEHGFKLNVSKLTSMQMQTVVWFRVGSWGLGGLLKPKLIWL